MLFLRNAMLHKKRCQRQIKEKTREASHVLQRAHLYPNSPARSFTILLVFAFPLSLNIFGQVYITEQSSKTLHQSWFLSLQLELFSKMLRVAFNFMVNNIKYVVKLGACVSFTVLKTVVWILSKGTGGGGGGAKQIFLQYWHEPRCRY